MTKRLILLFWFCFSCSAVNAQEASGNISAVEEHGREQLSLADQKEVLKNLNEIADLLDRLQNFPSPALDALFNESLSPQMRVRLALSRLNPPPNDDVPPSVTGGDIGAGYDNAPILTAANIISVEAQNEILPGGVIFSFGKKHYASVVGEPFFIRRKQFLVESIRYLDVDRVEVRIRTIDGSVGLIVDL